MNKNLHITNGDAAVSIMQEAGVQGAILAWRDVLHDGPVPAEVDLEALSRIRADYISQVGWGDFDQVFASFSERDQLLASAARFQQISLWFEHDLYDQLQVLQILDVLADLELNNTTVTMACSDVVYLGEMSAQQMKEFGECQQPVTAEQYALAGRAWSAYRQSNPEAWSDLLTENLSALPFLRDTIERTLQEFPDSRSGLSRSEQQVLSVIAGGEARPGVVFGECQKLEKRVFMGDSSFWLVINRLLKAENALLLLNHGVLGYPPDPSQCLKLTRLGSQVLAGEVNWLDVHQPDYYIGGVHCCLTMRWCYNAEIRKVIRLK